MARVAVDLRDIDGLIAGLAALPRGSSGGGIGYARHRILQQVAAEALRQHQERFSRRVAPDGTPWEPRQDRKAHPLLEKTGRLRGSLRAVPGGRRRDRIDVKAWGVPYSRVHQFGSEKRNIPRRQYLGFGAADLVDLAETAEHGLERFMGEILR